MIEMQNLFIDTIRQLPHADIEKLTVELVKLRERGGRLFLIGNGGGQSHASHAAADFRNLCGIDAHTVGDNVAYLTAQANDTSWDWAYIRWLESFNPTSKDAILVISVGGGSLDPKVSYNIVGGIGFGLGQGCHIWGIVGAPGGYTAEHACVCVTIPVLNPNYRTPVVEGVQSCVLHALVADPRVAIKKAKWESIQ